MPLARHFLSICALLSFVMSCSTVPKVTLKGKMVKVIKGPFAETCIQLVKIKYDGTPFIHEKELSIILKEMAAQSKGNAIRYDVFTPGVTGVSNAKGRATAFRCHKEKLRKYLISVENKAFGEEPTDQEGADVEEGPVTTEAAPKAAAPKTQQVPKPPKQKTRSAPADASSEP